jgi:hypothetical protein
VDSGRRPDPADLPPALEWEEPVWRELYLRLATQWRTGLNGRTGLDYTPAFHVIDALGWRRLRALDLLRAVEAGFRAAWKRASEAGG